MRKINSSDPGMTPRVKKALAHARKTTAAAASAPPAAPPTTPTTPVTAKAGSARKPAARSTTTKPGAPAQAKPAPAKPAGRGGATGTDRTSPARSGQPKTTTAGKPAATAVPAKPPARPPTSAGNGQARLRPGALREMIAEHLTANPKIEFTSSQLGNVLRRSSGAIANALVTLCELGAAVQTNDRPRTYQAARPKTGRRRAR